MSRQDSTKISDVKVLLKMGSNGSGIASIEKTGSDLNVDTYTITLDDGTKTTFTVTNGTSIASIEKTGTVGLVDTYTITLTDGSTSTFEVVNGEGSTASSVPYDNTISELTAENVQDAIDEIDATVDAQVESIEGIDAEIADMNNILGAKNFLPNNATTQAINGITFTVNNDGTLIANGTATANANLVLVSNLVLDAGSYILSGCPANGSVNTYYLYNDTVGSDYGNGFSFSYNIKTTTVRFGIMIKSGTTVSNITFKPMIRLATIKDGAYVPYSMTNRELSSQISNLSGEIDTLSAEMLPNYVLTVPNSVSTLKDCIKYVIDNLPTAKTNRTFLLYVVWTGRRTFPAIFSLEYPNMSYLIAFYSDHVYSVKKQGTTYNYWQFAGTTW